MGHRASKGKMMKDSTGRSSLAGTAPRLGRAGAGVPSSYIPAGGRGPAVHVRRNTVDLPVVLEVRGGIEQRRQVDGACGAGCGRNRGRTDQMWRPPAISSTVPDM
ncbi:hypothetical protein GCM10023167_03320 [Brevibacterium pityocampae]|uniref:Uncharacterized protein n=1 Tax=Brevibacterium pityocampae TaxID=506594 RepID=A0ABP8J237_9MICO